MRKDKCILTSLFAMGVLAIIVVNVNLAIVKTEIFSDLILANIAMSSESEQYGPGDCVTNTPKGSKMRPVSGFQCPKSGCGSYYSVSCVSDKTANGCTEVNCKLD